MLKSVIALALLANASAAAAQPPCITEREFRSVSLFLLPSLIEGAATRCAPHLPANAYLLNGARRLGERVAGEREMHKDAAVGALARLGDGKVPQGLSNDTLAGLLSDMARTELLKKVTAGDCTRIDEGASLLAPLPPENLVGLVGFMMRMGMRGDRKPPFRFCAAGRS